MKAKQFYGRNLPHLQPGGGCFFVTFRLKDSIPLIKLAQLKEKYENLQVTKRNQAIQYKLQKRFFGEYDQLLDAIESGPTYLKQPTIAQIVQQEIHQFDSKWYDLLAYTIMPNHVHLLVDTSLQLVEGKVMENNVYLHKIMNQIKGATARKANLALNTNGKFWQRESYDHLVRDDKELLNIIGYIVENPVKAGFVTDWENWKYTYWKDS